MNKLPGQAKFNLVDIQQTADGLLQAHPGAVVAWRLLREVLRLPADDPRLVQAKKAALGSGWVQQLEVAQLPDGSWGRFHSQDTQAKTDFRTTEEAIERAFALGLEPGDAVLTRVRDYILRVLNGQAGIPDRSEKNEAWHLVIQLILAGRLAQIDAHNPALEIHWSHLAQVADQAFASGEYCLEDETAAYRRLFGLQVPNGFLESQHALWILSSRQLPLRLERAIVGWVWHKADGIRYLRVPLADFAPRQIAYWLRSMNILVRFDAWREVSGEALDHLWAMRDADGLWDFGNTIARCVDFPLSESWRRSGRRRQDFSTCILALLRKYLD